MSVLRDRRVQGDIAVALLVFWLTRLTTTTAANPAVGLLTCGAACAALILRRHFPVAVLVVSAAAAQAYLVTYHGHDGDLILIAPMVAIYTVANAADRHHGLAIGGLAVLVLAAVHIIAKPTSPIGVDNLALAALGALAVAAGSASRSHRAYLSEVEARARQAEADRDTEAARRVTEERLRIARELHDAVGHQLALINVQAAVAAHVLTEPPEAARQALEHIGSASRAALAELSETVGLLRTTEEPAAPVDPVSGLADLPRLLDSYRRSGLSITESTTGTPHRIPPATDLVAYRVIQESLTNACKHAPGSTVEISRTYARTALRLEIRNTATTTAPPAAAGHGLLGMRERVTALGGTLHTGPTRTGFAVTAALPLNGPA
jgi:signal transduction histidine kinase